jgi:hypothetical protein
MSNTLTLLTLFSTLLVPVASASGQSPASGASAVDCGDWQDCRDRAITARDQGDFERFHDLAWRAVQKGPRNDGALLTLLARAQSVSGRPHDALVMLHRLAAMNVTTDAAESEDFRRVRALPGWADLRARIGDATALAADKPAADKASPAASSKTATAAVPKTDPSTADPSKPVDPSETDAAIGEVEDALRFTTIPFDPAGFAYDSVSKRFIMGDRRDRKLTVIGERSQRVVNLAGEETAGFGEIEAIAIDAREGDLWVASTPDGGSSPKLHKLQLISGRLLFTATLAEPPANVRLTDIAVMREGTVLALDGPGRRLFRLNPGARELEAVSSIDNAGLSSVATSPDGIVYVAAADGIVRLDSGGGNARLVKSSGSINLPRLECIRWYRGGLLGVQRSADGLFRIVRIRLDAAGRTATRVELLEKDVPLASPSSIAVTDEALFYLSRSTAYTASGGMDVTIRRVTLR